MRLALTLAVVLLASPASVSASTAAIAEDGHALSYAAAAGETNDLTVQGGVGSIVLTDPDADIVPGFGCAPSGDHSVTCSTDFDRVRVIVTLGDGDDRVRIDGGTAGGTLDGGPGADELIGGDEPDVLTGGPGADSIDGGADLGYGDTVSYREHADGVTVDLSVAGSSAGAAGEGDTVTGVENVDGGEGPDEITATDDLTSTDRGSWILGHGGADAIHGGPGRDELDGGDGDDRVEGGDGHDLILGEGGRDALDGGRGSDYVRSGDGARGTYERDVVTCGNGGDAVDPGGSNLPVQPLLDLIDQSCERVDVEAKAIGWIVHRHPRRPLRALRMKTACASSRCRLRIALRAHRRLAGSVERELRGPRDGTLAVPIGAEVRNELARAGLLRLRLTMAVRFGRHLRKRRAVSYYLVLRAQAPAR